MPSTELTRQLEQRLARVEAESLWVPELGPDVVSAGDFPGSIRIPRTDTAIKFGGRVRFATVFSLRSPGDRGPLPHQLHPHGRHAPKPARARAPTSAPAPAASTSTCARRRAPTTCAPSSRATSPATATPSGCGTPSCSTRASSPGRRGPPSPIRRPTPRISTSKGVSSKNITRQPLVRMTWQATRGPAVRRGGRNTLGVDHRGRRRQPVSRSGRQSPLALLGERPLASGRRLPRHPRRDHRACAAPRTGLSALAAASAAWCPCARRSRSDRIIFQVNGGTGIGSLHQRSQLAGRAGCGVRLDGTAPRAARHRLVRRLRARLGPHRDSFKKLNARSSLIWSYVAVDNVAAQAGDAYEHTNRLVGNIVVSPSPRLDVGFEYIWGMRRNKDGASGNSSQIQVVLLTVF